VIISALVIAGLSVEAVGEIFNSLTTVLHSFFSLIGDGLSKFLAPVIQWLQQLGTTFGQLLLPIIQGLTPVMDLLFRIIPSSLIPAAQLLAVPLGALAAFLIALEPLWKGLMVALEVVASPLRWLGDLAKWVGNWFLYFANSIKAAAFNTINAVGIALGTVKKQSAGASPGEFSSDAFSGLDERIAAILAQEYGSADFTGLGETGGGATIYGGNTTVQRVPDIYIYNHIHGDIFGAGGLQEFGQVVADSLSAYVVNGGRLLFNEG